MEPQDDLPSVGREGEAEVLPESRTNVGGNLKKTDNHGGDGTKTCSSKHEKERTCEDNSIQMAKDEESIAMDVNSNNKGHKNAPKKASMIYGVSSESENQRLSISSQKLQRGRESTSGKEHRRRSMESSEIRAVASTVLNSASLDFQSFIANRISYANMLQEGKLPLTSFKEFQEGVGIQPRYLYYSDNTGKCIMDTELQYVTEWWKVVKYWMKIVVAMTLFGHATLTVMIFSAGDPLAVTRLIIRCFVIFVALLAFLALPFLDVLQIRRLITSVVGFYLAFGVVLLDQMNLPVLMSEKYLNIVPCDYQECILAASRDACNKNSLPFVVAQTSIVVTLFRLPFTHVVTLVFFITTFYVSMSVFLKSSALAHVSTATWEMFPLCLTFWCLICSSQRGELLSRFLFIHAKSKYKEDLSEGNDGSPANLANIAASSQENPASPQSDNNEEDTAASSRNHNNAEDATNCDGVCATSSAASDASASSFGTVDTRRSELSSQGVDKVQPSRKTSRGANRLGFAYWISKFYGKKIFMSFENIIMRKSDSMCWRTIEFFNAEMEYCFLSARLRVSMKWAVYSGVLGTLGYAYLTYADITASGDLPARYVIWRIALRGIFFAVALGIVIFNMCLTSDIYHRSLSILFGTFVFLVVNLMSDPPLLESLVGVNTCGADATQIECAARNCYSILAVLTAEFSWVLVQMRMKFHHIFACLSSVCILFVVMNYSFSDVTLDVGELFCLVAAVCCFTIGAFRVDVTARALFIIEYERKDVQQEGAGKRTGRFRGENVVKIAKRAKNTVKSALSKGRSSGAT